MNDCLFCKILAGDIPSKKVYEDEFTYAFHDIAPQAQTHVLVISKKHVLSAVENHEDVYFLLCDNLSAEELKKHIDLTREVVLSAVKPHKEHMSTFATLVVLADTIEPEAKKLIKKTRFSKYFRLALHGWMEYHIAAMEISTNSFLSNPTGRGAKKILEGNFALKK